MDAYERRAKGQLHVRYPDVAQDGRIRIEALTSALGVLWQRAEVDEEVRSDLRTHGILPILTRYELETGDGPFPVDRALDVEGGFSIAHARGEDGAVTRIFSDMDAVVYGTKGRTNLPPPEDAGTRAVAGTVRAEHVFTRPFAAPGDRKVLALPRDGQWAVPGPTRAWRPPETALVPPPDARPLEPALALDPAPVALGLTHTDSNQHANSLVYPRLFEDAALRRLASLGLPTDRLAQRLAVTYRRPSFAGERLSITLRAFEHGPALVCVGAFLGEGDRDVARARVYVQMTFG